MPNASVPTTAAVEIGAIRWVTEPVGTSSTSMRSLVPGRERRALVHLPREEWTAVHLQVLCLRIMMWSVVGVVLDQSFVPLWLAGDPEALPILVDVLALGVAADAWLRRRLPPAS